jgi:5'-deoxynucleotidase YfbR-like HD superfamily hydrolase
MTRIALEDRPYTTTYSGRQISVDAGVPSLNDIALGLSRICRFAGQGRRFFSVASHALWMQDFARAVLKASPATQLAILLHDAHEAVMSDIPTPLKTLEQKNVQHKLDARIFDAYFHAYGGYEGFGDREAQPYQIVKQLDYDALLTEYAAVGPPHKSYLPEPPADVLEYFTNWLAGKRERHRRPTADEFISRVIRLM